MGEIPIIECDLHARKVLKGNEEDTPMPDCSLSYNEDGPRKNNGRRYSVEEYALIDRMLLETYGDVGEVMRRIRNYPALASISRTTVYKRSKQLDRRLSRRLAEIDDEILTRGLALRAHQVKLLCDKVLELANMPLELVEYYRTNDGEYVRDVDGEAVVKSRTFRAGLSREMRETVKLIDDLVPDGLIPALPSKAGRDELPLARHELINPMPERGALGADLDDEQIRQAREQIQQLLSAIDREQRLMQQAESVAQEKERCAKQS